jgi:hypothetical protein
MQNAQQEETKMRKGTLATAVALLLGGSLCTPALAAIEFFGTAKVKPTWYSNLDFDDNKDDAPTLNEGGWASGPHMRSELRLGWKASGDNWRVKMIAESDIIMNKDNVDRSFYVGAEKENQPNAGGEFGIERAEFGYTFSPLLDLSTGWDIRALDIKSGGLLYGDDHPFLGLSGKAPAGPVELGYELLYMPIQNNDVIGNQDSWKTGDWSVYTAKVNATFDTGIGKYTISPLFAFSDNEAKQVNTTYYGVEGTGKLGIVNFPFEVLAANGEFDDGGNDISATALFAGAEVAVNHAYPDVEQQRTRA